MSMYYTSEQAGRSTGQIVKWAGPYYHIDPFQSNLTDLTRNITTLYYIYTYIYSLDILIHVPHNDNNLSAISQCFILTTWRVYN